MLAYHSLGSLQSLRSRCRAEHHLLNHTMHLLFPCCLIIYAANLHQQDIVSSCCIFKPCSLIAFICCMKRRFTSRKGPYYFSRKRTFASNLRPSCRFRLSANVAPMAKSAAAHSEPRTRSRRVKAFSGFAVLRVRIQGLPGP